MTNLDLEYIRPAKADRFGLGKSTLYNLIADGLVETKVIRRPGVKKGIRLVSVESLRRYIEGSPAK